MKKPVQRIRLFTPNICSIRACDWVAWSNCLRSYCTDKEQQAARRLLLFIFYQMLFVRQHKMELGLELELGLGLGLELELGLALGSVYLRDSASQSERGEAQRSYSPPCRHQTPACTLLDWHFVLACSPGMCWCSSVRTDLLGSSVLVWKLSQRRPSREQKPRPAVKTLQIFSSQFSSLIKVTHTRAVFSFRSGAAGVKRGIAGSLVIMSSPTVFTGMENRITLAQVGGQHPSTHQSHPPAPAQF